MTDQPASTPHPGRAAERRIARSIVGALCLLITTVATSAGVLISPSTAAAYSIFNPPPLCSTSVYPCIRQPLPGYDSAPTPIRVDMPTMRLETLDANSPYSGEVTFSIIDPGSAPGGQYMRTPFWANPLLLNPIDADPLAGLVFMYPVGNCDGRYTCTYETTATGMKGGWYTAGYAGSPSSVAGSEYCPTANYSYGCGITMSESAVYIPQGTDKEPPRVHMAAAGSGLTTKAVAIARDNYGEAMSLTWDFGDGTPETPGSFGSVATHTYANVGAYEVIARVRTADGRNGSDSADAGVGPPRPQLLALGRVPAPNAGVAAVATAVVQGWPSGVVANVLTWDTGCPADPTSIPAQNSAVYSGYVDVAGDGTIDIAMATIDPAATAAVVNVEGYVYTNGRPVRVKRVSDCLSTIGTASKTTADTAIGATEIPVDSASVPIGHVAGIDSGVNAEHLLVTAHGSLIVGPLSKTHLAGAPVIDLGPPVTPYVVPGPPADPTPVPFDGSGGSGGGGGSTASYVPLTPARLLETRSGTGFATVDGLGLGAGLQPAGATIEVQVTDRAGVPAGASAAVLNITVADAQGPGFITAYPCGTPRPNASSLNYQTGSTIPNGVIAKIGDGGKVCLFTSNSTHLLTDITGYFPAGSAFTALTPARLLETRSGTGFATVDGLGLGAGLQPAGATIEVQVTDRAGVPAGASAAVLNITVADAQGPGFITAYPCGTPRPNASSLNYQTGSTIPNGVIAKIGDGGKVCLFTSNSTHLLTDITGYFPAGSAFTALTPARLLETRSGPGFATVDGLGLGAGLQPAGATIEVQVTDRAGVPAGASAAVLNITVADAQGPGFITAYPCGTPRPNASSLNYQTGSTIPNGVIAKIGDGGKVCLFTSNSTHLLTDITGYFPATV